MRDIIPYIFWPWFGISCLVLLRRRVSGGSWKTSIPPSDEGPITFPPPPPIQAPSGSTIEEERPEQAPPLAETPGTVLTAPSARSLAEALEGIAMPCDLTPLMGSDTVDPREVAFFTRSQEAADVGSAIADELERLDYTITPIDERTVKAERGGNYLRARIVSAATDPDDVIAELHPSAPKDSVVVELKLI